MNEKKNDFNRNMKKNRYFCLKKLLSFKSTNRFCLKKLIIPNKQLPEISQNILFENGRKKDYVDKFKMSVQSKDFSNKKSGIYRFTFGCEDG